MPRSLAAFLLLAPMLVSAQYKDARALIAGDLEAANAHFGGTVRFSIDKEDRLLADFYEGGDHYRQDVVYIEFLAPDAFAFSAEENVVMLKCMDEHARCIDKEIFKLNTISHTGRMNLPVPAGDGGGQQALALLGKLVRDKQLDQHDRSAETDRRGSRKK